jgi:hypothetical protein
MRLPVFVFVLLLAVPAPASAGTLALEGTELVFRGDAAENRLTIEPAPDSFLVRVRAGTLAAGAGCAAVDAGRVRCRSAGVTGLRLLGGDGDDSFVVGGPQPLIADLGAGDDTLVSEPGQTSVSVAAGPGKDLVEVQEAQSASVTADAGNDTVVAGAAEGATGPFTVLAGPGHDQVSLINRRVSMTLDGGDGDDRIHAPGPGAPLTIVCGAGKDVWRGRPRDRIGDGCAPTLSPISTRTVSRAFRGGSLTAAASGTVDFRRRTGPYGPLVARGTFTSQAGPLRVSLTPTRRGRRWLERHPGLGVNVFVRTRVAGDRGELQFRSRIG